MYGFSAKSTIVPLNILGLLIRCRFYENTSLCNALSRTRSNLDTYLTFEFTFYPFHPENRAFFDRKDSVPVFFVFFVICFASKFWNEMNSSEFHFSNLTLGGVHKPR